MSKIAVGISGGVDSAACALLLKEQGFDVVCVFLKMHPLSADAENDAREVANGLKLPFVCLDLTKKFGNTVISYFTESYKKCLTPNPCIVCNPLVKFRALFDFAKENDCEKIATGHYAGIGRTGGRYYILRSQGYKSANDERLNDQSYMLSRLPQDILSKTVFPLFGLNKSEIREKAHLAGLSVFDKEDSQEICFLSGDYRDFLRTAASDICKPGDYVLESTGEVLGKHTGLADYTVGQRKGLGISHGKPLYVTGLDGENNRVVLGESDVAKSNEIVVTDPVFQKIASVEAPIRAYVKVRYSSITADCTLYSDGDLLRAVFSEPRKNEAPGQQAVFYDDDGVLAAGFILRKPNELSKTLMQI